MLNGLTGGQGGFRLVEMDKDEIKNLQENENMRCFRYCPKCGKDELYPNTCKTFKCLSCGFEFFLNTAAAVAALITDSGGRLLITVRKAEPAKGTWDLPGGFADPGESGEETVRREIKEELGLDIVSARYLCSFPNIYKYGQVTYQSLDLVYRCEVAEASQAKAGDDVEAVLFKGRDDIDPEKFGLASIKNIIRWYLLQDDR